MISATTAPSGHPPAAYVEITPQVFMWNAPNRRVPFVAINTAQAAKVCAAAFNEEAAAAGQLFWELESDAETEVLTWHLLMNMKKTAHSLMTIKDATLPEDIAVTLLTDALPDDTRHTYPLTGDTQKQLPLTPAKEDALITCLLIPF